MEKKMTLDDLKKESYLLVFMLNHADSAATPFSLQKDGWDFIRYGGTKNIRSLQSMLQTLKRKGRVVNGSHGSWTLTTKGVKDAEYWMKICGQKRVKSVFAEEDENLEDRLGKAEVELQMAKHTNEYLDEQIQLLREENSKLKEKIALIQKIIA